MGVPIVYRKGTDPTISYSWTDLAGGTGYQTFYLSKDQTGYILTSSIISSDDPATSSGELTDGTFVKMFDQTFTSTLNTARVVNGTFIATIAGMNYVGFAGTTDTYFIVKFIKIVGSTETTIGTGTSTTGTFTNTDTAAHNQLFCVSIPVSNVSFKVGDKIGIRLEQWSKKTGGSTPSNAVVGHDPSNRVSATAVEANLLKTISTINIPFRIDT